MPDAQFKSECARRHRRNKLSANAAGRASNRADRDHYFVRREAGPAYGGKTIEALILGERKLLQDSPFAPRELYNLRLDPREMTNLAAKEPHCSINRTPSYASTLDAAGRFRGRRPRRQTGSRSPMPGSGRTVS